MRKHTRSLCIAAALVQITFPPVASAANSAVGCSAYGRMIDRGGGWTTIATPEFPINPLNVVGPGGVRPDGSEMMKRLAVDTADPSRLFALTSKVLMRSVDGGCTWATILDLSASSQPLPVDPSTTIEDIAVVPSKGRQRRIYLTLASAVPQIHVAISNDGGDQWELSDGGLLPLGARVDWWLDPYDEPEAHIYPAPGNPDVAYLTSEIGNVYFSKTVFYVTHDGGGSWEHRAAPPDLRDDLVRSPFQQKRFRVWVDPANADELWALPMSGPLYHSWDGATSWEVVTGPDDPSWSPISLDVFHGPGQPARLLAFSASFSPDALMYMYQSLDGGTTWDPQPQPPGTVLEVAHGNRADSVFLGTYDRFSMDPTPRLIRFDGRARAWIDFTPSQFQDAFAIRDLTFVGHRPTRGESTLYMMATSNVGGEFPTIERFVGRLR